MPDDPNIAPSDSANNEVRQRIEAKAKKIWTKLTGLPETNPSRQAAAASVPPAFFSPLQTAAQEPDGDAAQDLLRLKPVGQPPIVSHRKSAVAPSTVEEGRSRKTDKDNHNGDWMEQRSTAEALEELQACARNLRPCCRFMDSAHLDTWRKYLELFVVYLVRGHEPEAARYLESVLRRFASDGVPVAETLPRELWAVSALLFQRVITAAAEDPQIPLDSLHTLLGEHHTLMRRYQALPVAYSLSRLSIIPRLGLTGEGEADFIEARQQFQIGEEAAAFARAEEALRSKAEQRDLHAARYEEDEEVPEPAPSGSTCQDARLALLVEWLCQHRRDTEALALLETAYYGKDSECYPCGLGPTRSYAIGIQIALNQGKETLARQWLERVTTITELKSARWLFAAGHRAEGHARLGEIAETLAVLEKAAWYADDERISAWNRMWFHHNATTALRHLVPFLSQTNPAAIPNLQTRALGHAAKAAALAQAFDCRNGNTGVSGQFAV